MLQLRLSSAMSHAVFWRSGAEAPGFAFNLALAALRECVSSRRPPKRRCVSARVATGSLILVRCCCSVQQDRSLLGFGGPLHLTCFEGLKSKSFSRAELVRGLAAGIALLSDLCEHGAGCPRTCLSCP